MKFCRERKVFFAVIFCSIRSTFFKNTEDRKYRYIEQK